MFRMFYNRGHVEVQKDGEFWGSFDTLTEAKHEIEEEEKIKMYNVYKIFPNSHYSGLSLVAATDANEANSFIRNFVKQDKNNNSNSWGYCEVDETDKLEDVFSSGKGIIYSGIYYYG